MKSYPSAIEQLAMIRCSKGIIIYCTILLQPSTYLYKRVGVRGIELSIYHLSFSLWCLSLPNLHFILHMCFSGVFFHLCHCHFICVIFSLYCFLIKIVAECLYHVIFHDVMISWFLSLSARFQQRGWDVKPCQNMGSLPIFCRSKARIWFIVL